MCFFEEVSGRKAFYLLNTFTENILKYLHPSWKYFRKLIKKPETFSIEEKTSVMGENFKHCYLDQIVYIQSIYMMSIVCMVYLVLPLSHFFKLPAF